MKLLSELMSHRLDQDRQLSSLQISVGVSRVNGSQSRKVL